MSLSKQELLVAFNKQKKLGYTGRESSPTHLNSAIVEWNRNKLWSNSDAVILTTEGKGYVFLLYTFQKNIQGVDKLYCDIRHIITLEQFRGQGIGRQLFYITLEHMNQNKCEYVKVISDIKSAQFYRKIGLKESGVTKYGLTYFCNSINTLDNVPMPASDFPFMVTNPDSIL